MLAAPIADTLLCPACSALCLSGSFPLRAYNSECEARCLWVLILKEAKLLLLECQLLNLANAPASCVPQHYFLFFSLSVEGCLHLCICFQRDGSYHAVGRPLPSSSSAKGRYHSEPKPALARASSLKGGFSGPLRQRRRRQQQRILQAARSGEGAGQCLPRPELLQPHAHRH